MEKIVLAKVGDMELTKDDMVAIMRNLPQQQAQEVAGVDGRKRLLDEMVAGELFYLKAMTEKYEDEEGFKKLLEETKRTLLQRYSIQKVLEAVKVDKDEIEAHYEENKAMYTKGQTAKAKHILMAEEEDIIKVKEEISAGLAFAEAAKKYSTCPSKEQGGDLGSFEKGRMVPEFEEIAFQLEIGKVSDPVKTQFGYHLIVVDERTESSEQPLEEVMEQIEQELIMKKQGEVYHSEVAELKEIYPVTVNEENLA